MGVVLKLTPMEAAFSPLVFAVSLTRPPQRVRLGFGVQNLQRQGYGRKTTPITKDSAARTGQSLFKSV